MRLPSSTASGSPPVPERAGEAEARAEATLPSAPELPSAPSLPASPGAEAEPTDSLIAPGPRRRASLLSRPVAWVVQRLQSAKEGEAPTKITQERPLGELKGSLLGVEVGFTVSELHQVRPGKGFEIIHVASDDGLTNNVETVLGQRPIGKTGQRIELQGPALNTSMKGGEMPVGVRLLGLGITGDMVDKRSQEAVSYTVEAKITERTVADIAVLSSPMHGALSALLPAEAAMHTFSGGMAVCAAVLSGMIAVSTTLWAARTVADDDQSKRQKGFAVAHAAADWLRLFAGWPGAAMSAALCGASILLDYRSYQRAKAAADAEPPKLPP